MTAEWLRDSDVVPKPPEPRSEERIIAGWKGNVDVPLVSVVCHTYNHQHFIKDALNGFLMQETRFPFEIIVNDDASTDGTADTVKEYLRNYPRIIRATLHNENQWSKGITPRSFSFPKVRGSYIALCEGDDYWIYPKKLQEQVDAFQAGVSIVFHDALPLADDKILNGSYYSTGQAPAKGYAPHQMAGGCKIPTASALFISSPFKKEKHENIINGDHLIWATMASLGSAKFLPKAYSVYRHHPGGIWSARSIVDKVEPSLRSKRVIFGCVEPRFRTTAMLGFAGVAMTLMSQLLEQGERAQASRLMRSLYWQVLKMLPRCRIHNSHNLNDLLLTLRIVALRVPKAWLTKRPL
jgi:glycosyltransferase involved in cell wall biosynthesis